MLSCAQRLVTYSGILLCATLARAQSTTPGAGVLQSPQQSDNTSLPQQQTSGPLAAEQKGGGAVKQGPNPTPQRPSAPDASTGGIASALIFWTLAALPGLLYPLLLWIYFVRFDERKNLIARLLERSGEGGGAPLRRREGLKQKQEWEGRLDLDRASYIPPALIACVISIAAAVVMLAINLKTNELRLSPALLEYTKLATPAAVAGFAGAYLWGVYDFVDRFRILSLPPGALHMIWFRLLLGPVMGAFAQQLLAKDFAPVLVFALASIPVPSLLKWLQDTAAQRFAIGNQTPVVPPKWELVQGLTPDIIARLNEVGVSSVAHLSNQDPVNLLRRTNIEWRNILDMMDQAYLATYVDDGISKLRAKGVRGAIEMAILCERAQNSDANTKATAMAVIQSIAQELGKDEGSVRNLAQNLAEDPQVQRIWSLWWQPDRDSDATATTETGGTRELPPFEPPDRPLSETRVDATAVGKTARFTQTNAAPSDSSRVP
jgi:hypothetical protein